MSKVEFDGLGDATRSELEWLNASLVRSMIQLFYVVEVDTILLLSNAKSNTPDLSVLHALPLSRVPNVSFTFSAQTAIAKARMQSLPIWPMLPFNSFR